VKASNFSLFKSILTVMSPLCSHEFWDQFVNLYTTSRDSNSIVVGSTIFLTIWSLQIHEFELFFYLFRSSFIFSKIFYSFHRICFVFLLLHLFLFYSFWCYFYKWKYFLHFIFMLFIASVWNATDFCIMDLLSWNLGAFIYCFSRF
jgi:hypothetical protein